MFGSVRNVFASRWKALWWAAGVLLTAYCSVPSPDADSDPKAAAHAKHINPWAKGAQAQATQEPEHMGFKEMMKRVEEERRQQEAKDENPWAKKPEQKDS